MVGGGIDGSWNGVPETLARLGEYTTPSNLCLCQYPHEVSHCSLNRISVSPGKGLKFITNDVRLLLKYDGNYNW